MRTIYLSPSKIAAYENCPFDYWLKYERKVDTEETGAALGFGKAIDTSADAFLNATVTGTQSSVDTVAIFLATWREFTRTNVVRYNTQDTEESLTAVGEALASMFPQAWADSGFTLALDTAGKPICQRDLEVDLGNGVILRTKLDLAVYNRRGEFGILDNKTTKTPSSEEFTKLADQLTAYQIVVLAHAASLGIDTVDFLGFWEFLKRSIPKKKGTQGPYINTPEIVPARTERAMQDYVRKAHWIADSIRAGHFPRTPRMAWNTPCGLCEKAALCANADPTGLRFRSDADRDLVMAQVD